MLIRNRGKLYSKLLALVAGSRQRKRAIVIGDGSTGRRFFRYMEQHKALGYNMVKYVDGKLISRANGTAIEKINSMAINKNGRLGHIDEVFITEPETTSYEIEHLAEILAGHAVRLRVVTLSGEWNGAKPARRISKFGQFQLISIRQEPLEQLFNKNIKRYFDVLFSLCALLFICSWLFPLIALLIRLNSPGPVFFQQERWGRRNKPFICFKFRSMYINQCDVDQRGTFQQARKGDVRITPIGSFLRRTNLDELPQFINVLLGQMSVVGPRPHASLMNIASVETIDRYLVRHSAKPGITGWAQVNGLRGESSDLRLLEARVHADEWYIENWTLWLDLKIIFLTILKMITGDKQAY